MIDLKRYNSEIDDLTPGETIRVNHQACSAGEDTRRRLYITRTHGDSTKVIGYCHNCTSSGVLSSGYTQYRDDLLMSKRHNVPTQVSDKVVPLTNLINLLGHWDIYGRSWAMVNKITQPMLTANNISQTPEGKIYIPRYNECGFFTGYQLRNVQPNNRQPKYTTILSDRDRGYSVFGSIAANNVVIVEDTISAIHIVDAYTRTGYVDKVCAIANHGTRTNVQLLELCINKSAVVWLDNDAPSVVQSAQKMARTLKLMSDGEVEVVREDYSDPKHYNPIAILDILEETNAWTV